MAARTSSGIARQATRCLAERNVLATRTFARTMATEANPSSLSDISSNSYQPSIALPDGISPLQHTPPQNPFLVNTRVSLHAFPSLEPAGYTEYPSTHLLLPLRRDILHRAVVFEGDAERSGTASTKWRGEVHGSGRKMRAQKGSGKARVGDKKSPILKGGGVAHGPKPRDFSTDLPPKYYDLAWRTALSYRYRRGQLVVIKDTADLEHISAHARGRYMTEMLQWHQMGHKDGRTTIITARERPALEEAFLDSDAGREAEVLQAKEVDVKNLLELGRIMIEEQALYRLLKDHQSDLQPAHRLANMRSMFSEREQPQLNITTSVRS